MFVLGAEYVGIKGHSELPSVFWGVSHCRDQAPTASKERGGANTHTYTHTRAHTHNIRAPPYHHSKTHINTEETNVEVNRFKSSPFLFRDIILNDHHCIFCIFYVNCVSNVTCLMLRAESLLSIFILISTLLSYIFNRNAVSSTSSKYGAYV